MVGARYASSVPDAGCLVPGRVAEKTTQLPTQFARA